MTPSVVPAEQAFPPMARAANVDIGRQDFLSTVWRLTRMELRKLTHRIYPWVILSILSILLLLFLLLEAVSAINTSQRPLSLAREAVLHNYANTFGFPTSLYPIGVILSYSLVVTLGLFFLAPIMGNEYGMGTIRLLFTRGPSRLQCLLGKALASLIYVAGIILCLTLLYLIVGMLIYPTAGQPYSYAFAHFNDAHFGMNFGNACLLLGMAALSWYAFGILALFFGTLGRSTAAALSGALVWFVLELLLPLLCNLLLGLFPSGPMHTLLQALPDYVFLGNLQTLAHNRMAALAGQSASVSSDLHALIVVAVYFVLLIGSSCVITMRRDITN
jgi:ABC-type transport system involved in multi-copper enzyme maturation permease subunit